MFTLLKTLHVVFAVFLVGPATLVPMTALRAIRRRDATALHGTARTTMIYTLGTVLVAVVGFGLAGVNSTRYSLGRPWLVISMTMYVIALALALAVLVPCLRRVAKLLEPAAPSTGDETASDDGDDGAAATTGTDEQRVASLYGRTAATAGLVTVLFLAITVLMVTRPGG